ncbi:MAG: hypothetical protein ACW96U_10365 [Candidatus Heimdallarchaeaceae archaeon]|jgi:hypothetical protein
MITDNLFIKQYELAECSVDGDSWYDISEISALCSINNHYCAHDLDAVLNHYNSGHIVPVEYVLYRKKRVAD